MQFYASRLAGRNKNIFSVQFLKSTQKPIKIPLETPENIKKFITPISLTMI